MLGRGWQRAYSQVQLTRSLSTARGFPPKVLITGALGQIGLDLVPKMVERYGRENVIGTDTGKPQREFAGHKLVHLDARDFDGLDKLVKEEGITWMIHNASLLSVGAEKNPLLALQVNMRGVENALLVSAKYNLRLLSPSSIAAFGPSTPPVEVPDFVVQRPTSMYGVSKVYTELLGEYFAIQNKKLNDLYVDFRSLRYPGIISADATPGNGTTDYAIAIYHEALKTGSYECYLRPDTRMPMMYMPDCVECTLQLLEADAAQLKQRTYNVTAMSFTPEEVAAEIQKHIPSFKITYKPDGRQAIADSWPRSLDDHRAREDWHHRPQFDLASMTSHMLDSLRKKFSK